MSCGIGILVTQCNFSGQPLGYLGLVIVLFTTGKHSIKANVKTCYDSSDNNKRNSEKDLVALILFRPFLFVCFVCYCCYFFLGSGPVRRGREDGGEGVVGRLEFDNIHYP